MTNIIKHYEYVDENNRIVFVERYIHKSYAMPLYRYGGLNECRSCTYYRDGLFSRPKKKTLMNIYGSKKLELK